MTAIRQGPKLFSPLRCGSASVPWPTSWYRTTMMRARYLIKFPLEFGAYLVVSRAWWMLPLCFILFAATVLVVVGQAAVPITLYSFF